MFILNADEKRVLRKHFQSKGIPLTLANIEKFLQGGDAVKTVFISDAEESGFTTQQAEQLYSSIYDKVGVKETAKKDPVDDVEPISGELFTEEEKKDLAEPAVQDNRMFISKDRRELPSDISPPMSGLDEILKKESVLKKDRLEEDLPPEPQVGPEGEISDEAPPATVIDFQEEPEEELGPDGKPKLLKDYEGKGSKFEVGELPTGTPLESTDIEDKPSPTGGTDVSVTRPSAIDEADLTLGAAPAMSRRQDDKGSGLTPKEVFRKVEPQIQGFTPKEKMLFASGLKKILEATPGQIKLKPDGTPVVGRDGQYVRVGKKEADLTPEEIQIFGKLSLPGLYGGSSHTGTTRSAEEGFKKYIADPDLRKRYIDLFDALTSQIGVTGADDTDAREEERKQNILDEVFDKRLQGLEAKRDYKMGMSAIDKKKMVDHIIKGLGQIAAGAVGQWGFQRAVPVGEKFKYDLKDYGPETKALAGNYQRKMQDISDEILNLEKLAFTPEVRKQRIAELEKLLGHFGNFIVRTSTEYQQNVDTKDTYAGLLKQIGDAYDRLLKIKELDIKQKQPPRAGTNVNVGVEYIDKKSQGSDQQIKTQLDADEKLAVRAFTKYDRFKSFWDKFSSATEDEQKVLLSGYLNQSNAGASFSDMWLIYKEYIKENGPFSDPVIANSKMSEWLKQSLLNIGAQEIISKFKKQDITSKSKGGSKPAMVGGAGLVPPKEADKLKNRAIKESKKPPVIEKRSTPTPQPTPLKDRTVKPLATEPKAAGNSGVQDIMYNGKPAKARVFGDTIVMVVLGGEKKRLKPGDAEYNLIKKQLAD